MIGALKSLQASGARHASTYVRPGNRTSLPRRRLARLRLGDTRPAVYYKFDQVIELSDGSTVNRRTVSPNAEIKQMTDARNSVRWNPSLPDIGAMMQDASGKMAKFRARFADLAPESDTQKAPSSTESAASAAKAAKEKTESAFDDLLSEGADDGDLSQLEQIQKKSSKNSKKGGKK